jgi:hypothetical protein
VGENFGGGLFSTSPENLVTDFDHACLLEDWNCSSQCAASAIKNKVFSEICILEETLDLNFQKLIALSFRS